MKATLLSVAALLVVALAHAQEEPTTAEDSLFARGIAFYENEEYGKAAESFHQFLDTYRTSAQRGRAHFNLALSYAAEKDYVNAKKYFLEILDQPYNEQDENNLMEPYALYKHHACRQLAFIALEEKNYLQAGLFIRWFDEKFPYQHFCGNEWAAYDMFKAVMDAKVLAGTGHVHEGIEKLVPFIFDNGLASNEGVLDELIELFEQLPSADVKKAFNDAAASLVIEKKRKDVNAYVTLFGIKVNVASYYFEDDSTHKNDKDYYASQLRNHRLFRMYL